MHLLDRLDGGYEINGLEITFQTGFLASGMIVEANLDSRIQGIRYALGAQQEQVSQVCSACLTRKALNLIQIQCISSE